MAADPALNAEVSPSFIRNNEVFCNSECQSCSLLKSDFKVLVNEIKSMTETINILKEELIYNNTKLEGVNNHVCDGKLKASSVQCRNRSQLENQLKETLNELSSVKLIAEILNEEIKSLNKYLNTDPNSGNSWLCAKPSNSHYLTTVQPPKEVNTTHGFPFTCQYTVPVASWYSILSNSQEPQESNNRILSSSTEQTSRFMPDNNYEHIEEH